MSDTARLKWACTESGEQTGGCYMTGFWACGGCARVYCQRHLSLHQQGKCANTGRRNLPDLSQTNSIVIKEK